MSGVMGTPFVSKPSDVPQGDPAGQAVASLKGYAYQLYVSALAWLNLGGDEELYLEVAQDYATAAKGALKAVQVKDTRAKVTIKSSDIRQAIDDFVDLIKRNPEKEIALRFLTTSKIGTEQKVEDRAAGEPTLKYWEKAAGGADIGPLRKILERIDLNDITKQYIKAFTDEQLRNQLLRRIFWDCGAPGFDQVKQQLEDRVIVFANEHLKIPPSTAMQAVGAILQHVLETVVEPETSKRALTRAALLKILEKATYISIPRSGLETHLSTAFSEVLDSIRKPSLEINPSPQFDIARDALERDFSSRYKQAQQRSFFPELQKQDQFQPLAQQILDGNLVPLSEGLRRRIFLRATRSAAVKGDLPAAERFMDAAAGLRGPDTDSPARARLAEAHGDIDAAIQILRDEIDPDSQATLLSIVAKAHGVDAAVRWLEGQRLRIRDLSASGIFTICNFHLAKEEYEQAKELLESLCKQNFEDCPYLLLLRGAIRFASVLAKPEQRLALMGLQLDIRRVRPVTPSEQTAATLDGAIEDIRRFIPIVKELGLPETTRVAEDYVYWFELLHPSHRQAARARLESDMQDPAIALKRIQFALAYLPNFNPAPILKHLENRAAFGGLNEDELRAGLAILMEDHGNTAPLAAFIARHRGRLDDAFGKPSIRMIEVQALARAGDASGARAVLDANRDAIEPDELARLSAEVSTAEGADPVTEFKRAYDTTGTTGALRDLIAVLSQRHDHRSIGPCAEELFERTGDPMDLAFAAHSYAKAGDDDSFMRVLEANNAVVDRDSGLRRHYAWQLLSRGRLAEALAEARRLAQEATTRDLDLEIAIAIESGEWEALSQPLNAYLQAAPNMPAIALIRAARLSQAAGQGPHRDLVSAALAKGADDPNVLLGAYTVYVEEGLEDTKEEAHQWFRRALDLSGPDGPIRRFELKDLLERQTEWNEQTSRIQEGVVRGEIPLTIAILGLRTTLVDVLLRNFTRNAALADARRKVAVPVFSGRRQPGAFGEIKRLALDFTALLVLGWLGLLPKVFDIFQEVVLPSGVFRELFEGRRRIREFQKSRLRRAERLQQAIASGRIKVVRTSLSRHDPLVVEVGDELAGLLRAAESTNGVVLRPAPVHKPGVLNQNADISPYAQRLADMHSLLGVLQDNGLTDQSTEETAQHYFTLQDSGWPSPARPDPKYPLYIDDLAFNYLHFVGLLDTVLKAFPQVFIASSTADEAAALVEHDKHTIDVLLVIDTIRESVRKAQIAGKIVFGPQRSRKSERANGDDDNDDDETFASSTLNLVANLGQADVVVIDDRALNKEPFAMDSYGHRARVVTSLDVIEELNSRRAISDGERHAFRHRLRIAGASLIPLDTEEVVSATLRRRGSDPAELRAMKESMLLARVAALPRFPSEIPWFATTMIAINHAILAVWGRERDSQRAATLADTIRDLPAHPEDWVDQWDGQVPPRWVNAVSVALAARLTLPLELKDKKRMQAYNRWIENRVLDPLRGQAPETYAAVVEGVRFFINSLAKDSDG
ncbi:hypothetical protein [Inquilinus limosus]|uniref:HTH domain-containing protein n=1 Tax=Inquilinus limosus TaxID=171674 RepID=UPI00040F7CCA|nr:hypothetical protein [Inquilinus limosus]